MSFFIAEDDAMCPQSTAEEYISQMQTSYNIITIEAEDHYYFSYRAYDDWFFSALLGQLAL